MAHAIEVNERLQALTQAGTSVWLDQIRRSLIESGELERMVREDSLRGVTSNPAIFEKSILGADEYDGQIEEMTKAAPTRAACTAPSPSRTSRTPATSCAPSGRSPATPTASSPRGRTRTSRTTPTSRSSRPTSTGRPSTGRT
jgi:hypothetical protein